MSAQTIPTLQGTPYYSQVTNLEGTDYVFTFAWNHRESTWYLTIGQPNGSGPPTNLAALKIVSNWPLLRRFTNTALPLGELIAVCSPKGDKSPPGLNDFGPGLRVELTYFPSADLTPGPDTDAQFRYIPISDATAGHIYKITVGTQTVTYIVPAGATALSVSNDLAVLLSALSSVTSAIANKPPYPPGVNVTTPAGTAVSTSIATS